MNRTIECSTTEVKLGTLYQFASFPRQKSWGLQASRLFSRHYLAVHNMVFKPASNETCPCIICEVRMIRSNNVHEVWIRSDTQVISDILKHNLNHSVTVRDVLSREPGVSLAQ